jgi:hypothetical protein
MTGVLSVDKVRSVLATLKTNLTLVGQYPEPHCWLHPNVDYGSSERLNFRSMSKCLGVTRAKDEMGVRVNEPRVPTMLFTGLSVWVLGFDRVTTCTLGCELAGRERKGKLACGWHGRPCSQETPDPAVKLIVENTLEYSQIYSLPHPLLQKVAVWVKRQS